MSAWTLDDLIRTLSRLNMAHPSTAMLSDLDEGTYQFRDRSGAVAEAHATFQQARYAHEDAYRHSRDETEPWQQAVKAGAVLARALRDTQAPPDPSQYGGPLTDAADASEETQ